MSQLTRDALGDTRLPVGAVAKTSLGHIPSVFDGESGMGYTSPQGPAECPNWCDYCSGAPGFVEHIRVFGLYSDGPKVFLLRTDRPDWMGGWTAGKTIITISETDKNADDVTGLTLEQANALFNLLLRHCSQLGLAQRLMDAIGWAKPELLHPAQPQPLPRVASRPRPNPRPGLLRRVAKVVTGR